MHRTGTSAVAGALSKIGVDFGKNLMPANPFNEKGYFEDIRVVRLNDIVLKSHNASWKEPKPVNCFNLQESKVAREIIQSLQKPLWGMKDPRFCLTLKAWWRELILYEKDIKVIITFRSPEAIAQSLEHRDRFSERKSYELIKEYWFHLIKAIIDLQISPIIILYENLIKNPEKELSKTGLEVSKEAINFIDPRLNHAER